MPIGVSLVVMDALAWVERVHHDLMAGDFAGRDYLLVAVDNGSTDGTPEWLEDHGWTVIRNPTNIGIVAARNQSFWRMAASNCEYALEIHADMRFPKRWFDPVLAAMDDPDVYIACPRIVPGYQIRLDIATAALEEVEDVCRRKLAGELCDDRWIVNLNHPCLHRMAPFRARGFYDDRFKWQEFEDTDLFYDYKFVQGKKVVVVGDSVVYHLVAGQRLEICTTAHAIENEAYFRAKWGLETGYVDRLFPFHSGDNFVLLSGAPIDATGGGQQPTKLAEALAAAGKHVVFVADEAPKLPYHASNIVTETFASFAATDWRVFWDGHEAKDYAAGARSYLDNADLWRPGTLVVLLPCPAYLALARVLKRLGWRIVYWELDDWAAFAAAGDAFWYTREAEDAIIDTVADVHISVSGVLAGRMSARSGRPCHHIPNGYEPALFAGKRRARHPEEPVRIGYWGSLYGNWFDWSLVEYLATRRPHWEFTLIGDHTIAQDAAGCRALMDLPNVALLGERPNRELPRHASMFDVGIIPFKDCPVTWAVSPIKGFQYLACGLPVVSRPMWELADAPWSSQAREPEEFLDAIERALDSVPPAGLDEWLQHATWGARATAFLDTLI